MLKTALLRPGWIRPTAQPAKAGFASFVNPFVLAGLGAIVVWAWVFWRMGQLSAVPVHVSKILLDIVLLTAGHYLIGRAILSVLMRAQSLGSDAWAWYSFTGYAAGPAALWFADRCHVRWLGWSILLGLAVLGLVHTLWSFFRRGAASQSISLGPLLAILLMVGAAAAFRLDMLVYLRDTGSNLAVLEADNLAHAAFSLEWARQEPYRHFWLAFLPEHLGISYHYFTDVQLAAWCQLCGGNHLDIIHQQRFFLAAFALMTALYLLFKALSGSTRWALVWTALLTCMPVPIVLNGNWDLEITFYSYTVENSNALGAAFLACVWLWLYRGGRQFAGLALLLGCALVLAKTYTAMVLVAGVFLMVTLRRPPSWSAWLASLATLCGLALASVPRGDDVITIIPEFRPGHFWVSASLTTFAKCMRVTMVGQVLALACAWAAVGRPSRWSASARHLALAVLLGWGIFLVFISFFWIHDECDTAYQFIPCMSLLVSCAILLAARPVIRRLASFQPRLVQPLTVLALLGWGGALAVEAHFDPIDTESSWFRAAQPERLEPWQGLVDPGDGFGGVVSSHHLMRLSYFALSRETHDVLEFLRTRTPIQARVLAPFDRLYGITGLAGRRGVMDHDRLNSLSPRLEAIYGQMQEATYPFFHDPQPDLLQELAGRWGLGYAVVPAEFRSRFADARTRLVYQNAVWCVLEVKPNQ